MEKGTFAPIFEPQKRVWLVWLLAYEESKLSVIISHTVTDVTDSRHSCCWTLVMETQYNYN